MNEHDKIRLQKNAMEIAKMAMRLQNANPYPETGTLGFISGLAIALGNTAAVYTTGMTPKEKKDFERIIVGMVKDNYRRPFVTGTVTI